MIRHKSPRTSVPGSPHAGNSAKTLISLKPRADVEAATPSAVDRTGLLQLADIDVRAQLDGIVTEDDMAELEQQFRLPSLSESQAARERQALASSQKGSTWARFHFPQAKVSSYGRIRTIGPELKVQHYDVMVNWDYDAVNLSSDYGVWSPDFCRAFFTYQTMPGGKSMPASPPSSMHGISKVNRSAVPRKMSVLECNNTSRTKMWSKWSPAPINKMDTLEILNWVRQLKPRLFLRVADELMLKL
ncbi:hypothetical protein CYMTET_45135 [Cymbomonas tetramitiformis]|uniref:Uncharacterized protein n=1 Tax=Cymbomonas tetramitiformis TaxID=36881 RepID=A0AAE0EYW7_9CHLO|nr:hypothetical protein CYMTET_45135 [Cymbomonas tetramitiformis]